MGIKFLGSGIATSSPAPGSIGERELALSWVNGLLYTSSDGSNIIQLASDRGVTYSSTTSYKEGDVVSYLGDLFVIGGTPPAIGTPPTSTNSIFIDGKTEKGGISWAGSIDYVVGDIVADAGRIFVCKILHTSAPGDVSLGAPLQPNSTSWRSSDNRFNIGIDYLEGDMVAVGDNIFVAPAAGIPSGSTEPTMENPGAWLLATPNEQGGVQWKTENKYVVGDMVYQNDGSFHALYLCITNDATGVSPVGSANWAQFGLERGGILWHSLKTYTDGDMVSASDGEVYIAIASSTGADPVTPSPAEWKIVGSVSSNASTGGQDDAAGLTFGGGNAHIPDPAINNNGSTEEYPSTSSEALGAIWTISGLGNDNSYIMIAGDLNGALVVDGDTIQWTAGETSVSPGDGSETWFHKVAPKISAERGGLAWQSTVNYVAGDIVTDALVMYTANIVNTNKQPSTSSSEWSVSISPEVGGVSWKNLISYAIGDVVVDAGIAYLCNSNHISDTTGTISVKRPSDSGTAWTEIGIPEIAGRQWSSSNVYAIGDTVIGTDNVLFRSITGGINKALPAVGSEENTDWSSNIIFDPGTY